jgi:hypothetical protein
MTRRASQREREKIQSNAGRQPFSNLDGVEDDQRPALARRDRVALVPHVVVEQAHVSGVQGVLERHLWGNTRIDKVYKVYHATVYATRRIQRNG